MCIDFKLLFMHLDNWRACWRHRQVEYDLFMSYVTINGGQTGAHGLQAQGSCFLPSSSSLSLCGAPLLSTFRGAGSAQADEYGHAPFSSESTERDKEKDREKQKADRKEEEEEEETKDLQGEG